MTLRQKNKLIDIFNVAYHDFDKGLNARAFYKVHNKSISGDLVQDTYIKTWSYLVNGGKIDMMKAFLYHALNNLIIDEYRKHKTISLDNLSEKGFEPNTGNPENLSSVPDRKATLPLIQRLPLAYQKVMRMRYVQDLSLSEMSLISGQTKNALTVKIHRGIAKLKILYNA